MRSAAPGSVQKCTRRRAAAAAGARWPARRERGDGATGDVITAAGSIPIRNPFDLACSRHHAGWFARRQPYSRDIGV